MKQSLKMIKGLIVSLTAGAVFSLLAADVSMPEVKKLTLSNNLKVFAVHDQLPLLTVALSIGFGSLHEKEHNAGIADILAKSLTLGGSQKYPGQKLHETIEQIGGKFSVSASWEHTVISITVLEKYSSLAFDILTDLMKNPEFSPQAVGHAKMLSIESIKRRNDSPQRLAVEKVRSLIFNKKGYGATATQKSVKAVTPEIVKEQWKTSAVSENIMLGLSTSLPYKEVKKLVRPLSAIKKGKKQVYDGPLAQDYKKLKKQHNTIYLIPRKLTQSTVVCGTIAPVIKHRHDNALILMNKILGGGSFSSRLMREIRVQRGLAYSVQSVIKSRNNTGVFLALAQTKNASVAEVISIMKKNFNKIAGKKVTESELKWAKNAISNSYVFNFETPLALLSNVFFVEYNNLPADYHETYLKAISGVSQGDVMRSAAALFDNGMVYVVVGPETLKTALSRLGTVKVAQ